MSDQKPPDQKPSGKLGEVILAALVSLFLGGIGVWMFLMPHLLENAHPDGRRIFYKMLLKWTWGRPFGVILVLLGALILYGAFLPKSPDDDDDDDDEK